MYSLAFFLVDRCEYVCLFSRWSKLNPSLLSEHVWRRNNRPILRAEVLQGIVPEHIHHTWLWASNDGQSPQQTSFH